MKLLVCIMMLLASAAYAADDVLDTSGWVVPDAYQGDLPAQEPTRTVTIEGNTAVITLTYTGDTKYETRIPLNNVLQMLNREFDHIAQIRNKYFERAIPLIKAFREGGGSVPQVLIDKLNAEKDYWKSYAGRTTP